ncbi:MAG: hypothetical protein IJI35_10350 [Kiritimatiellae bacterium]|nr:hypothetical protein [Kiritimatiellia bacterium]
MTTVGRRVALLTAFTMCAGGLLAYDTYYWVDSGDHDMAAAANWRLNSSTGEVPATFPPTLDTATGGSTHPLLRVPGTTTLSLPNDSSLTVNWLGVIDANADCTIDLGSASKTLYLFGGSDAAFWIGHNNPNGQRVVLKSGTISRYTGTTRHNRIRLGAAVASRGNLASFIADGASARLFDFQAALDSGNVLFCLTNGATFSTSQANAIWHTTGVSNAVFRVAGEGSLFTMTSGNRGVMMGDAAPAATPVRAGGTIEVLGGGAISNVYGIVGNRSGYHAALLDDGKWYAKEALVIGSYPTSDGNSVVMRNKSRFSHAAGVAVSKCNITVGEYGHDNSLYVEDSEVEVATLCVGMKDGASGNSAVFSNATFLTSTLAYVGGKLDNGNALYATNNSMTLVDCSIGSAESPSMQIIVGAGVHVCSSRLDVVRTEWYPAGSYFGVGGTAPTSTIKPTNEWFNVMRLDDHSLVSYPVNYVYFGRGGCSNRIEVVNSSTLVANNLQIGDYTATQLRPTSGNMLYVGKDSLVRVTSHLIVYPERARIVIDDGTFRAESVINWHNYWSKTQNKNVDNLNDAEADGMTFDTELKFMGENPRFEFTNSDRDLGFDAGERLSFVLPELPYANAAIYGARNVNFTNVADYSFDLSGVGVQGGKYVLAEAANALNVNAAELERMNAALPSTRKARVYVSGKQLILRVGSTHGLSVIIK